ncbi:MAG TPA: hypothetical protein DD672_11140, partial [Gammaproteobacteria bacterium]|nr:hypothetical protein [Gammaproteobacteria bacterium]
CPGFPLLDQLQSLLHARVRQHRDELRLDGWIGGYERAHALRQNGIAEQQQNAAAESQDF